MQRIGISVREFGRREHCDESTVRRALREGRLARLKDGSLDPELVGSPWRPLNFERATAPVSDDFDALSTYLNDIDASAATMSYADALRMKAFYTAQLRRLEYEAQSGALIDLSEAERVVFELFRGARDAWLNWPARVAPLIAADLNLDDVEQVQAVLSAHVHQQLCELGEPPTLPLSP